MPPERTDRERIAQLEHHVESLQSDYKSLDGDIKSAAIAAQVRHSDADELYRIVMDDKEGLRQRVRSLEETRVENEKLKSYISGQIRTWVLIGTGILGAIQLVAKFWPHK